MVTGVIPFLVGLLGIVAFIVFRTIEVKHNIKAFPVLRKRLDGLVIRLYRLLVLGEIPTGYRVWISHMLHTVGHVVVSRAASLLRSVEQILSNMSRKMIARRPNIDLNKSPSYYLKNISPKQEKGEKSVGKNGEDSV